MADQSVFSRYPKKQFVFISEKLIDESFDINLYNANEYEESYNKLENIGKYFNQPISDEDVQFFAKFIEINDDILAKIFGGDKSLIESLVIPIAKDYEVEYTVDGSCYYTEYYTYNVSSYEKGWVDSMIQYQYGEGIFDFYEGNIENTEYDNYEMNDWNIQKVNDNLSNNNGVIVRIYNKLKLPRQLLKEYVLPSINYYAASANDGLFSESKGTDSRIFEFITLIRIPPGVTNITFNLFAGSASALYIGSTQVLSITQSSAGKERATNKIQVSPGEKLAIKIVAYEGVSSQESYIILKWKKGTETIYEIISSNNYFMPNMNTYSSSI